MSETVQWLWPIPIVARQLTQADAWRAPLLELVSAERGAHDGPQFASEDDLLQRHPDHAVLQAWSSAVAGVVGELARQVNAPQWHALRPQRMRVVLTGVWCQSSNRGARHDVHNHGNCSWSGVYIVDVDPAPRREAHEVHGAANGLTRLHSPHLARLGGAYMDLGAAWLQDSHVDLAPEPGRLAVWPSFLLHQALPYEGERDRVVLAFNAAIHGQSTDQVHRFGF